MSFNPVEFFKYKNKNLNILLVMRFLRIYEEIQKIEANEFHYQEQVTCFSLILLSEII